MRICSKCGAQSEDGAPFCGNCGAKLDGGAEAPAYGGTSSRFHRPVQTDRSLVMYILLTLVTCGIYSWYFIYKLAEDANEICYGDGEQTPGLGMFILLSFVTCGFYSYYWLYKLQNRFQATSVRYGIPVAENGTTVLMWYIFGAMICGIGPFIGMNIIISTANKLGTAYNMKYVYNS